MLLPGAASLEAVSLAELQRFKSARHAERFLSAHSRIRNHLQLRRHPLAVGRQRAARDAAFRTWRKMAGVASAA